MDRLISDIYQIVKDYRIDENDRSVEISEEQIFRWINQFESKHRSLILNELKNILKKRYITKNNAMIFLLGIIEQLANKFHFNDCGEFLLNVTFLNLQPTGKSQNVLLENLNDLLLEKYDITLNECGSASQKYSIYIDDVLCTGNTTFQNLNSWLKGRFNEQYTNSQAIENSEMKLILIYLFYHSKNGKNVRYKLVQEFGENCVSKILVIKNIVVENKIENSSALNFILPLDQSIRQIKKYQKQIISEVNEYRNSMRYNLNTASFFRPSNLPTEENFFTSRQNREKIESLFLIQGIEILSSVYSWIPNMRALGYSLKSHKDFGFGALCFTWRNIPNNTPLIFWYSVGGWQPLFNVSRRETQIFFEEDFDSEYETEIVPIEPTIEDIDL